MIHFLLAIGIIFFSYKQYQNKLKWGTILFVEMERKSLTDEKDFDLWFTDMHKVIFREIMLSCAAISSTMIYFGISDYVPVYMYRQLGILPAILLVIALKYQIQDVKRYGDTKSKGEDKKSYKEISIIYTSEKDARLQFFMYSATYIVLLCTVINKIFQWDMT